MITCYEHRNNDIMLSSDDMTPEEWGFVCNLFGYSNSEKVLNIIVKNYDVDVLEKFY